MPILVNGKVAVQLNFGDRVNIEKTEKDKLPKSAFEPRSKSKRTYILELDVLM